MTPEATAPSGPLALVGSGEYLPVMAGVEGALIDGRPRRYVQIPTAAAPEGDQRLRYWLGLGAAQAERLGVEQVPVVVRDRDEAESADLAALVHVPAVRAPVREPDRGLGVLPWLRVLPHFDKLSSWAPQLVTRATAGSAPGTAVIGIDEDTAIIDLTGGGRSWQVLGRQQAWRLDGGPRRPFPAGTTVRT